MGSHGARAVAAVPPTGAGMLMLFHDLGKPCAGRLTSRASDIYGHGDFPLKWRRTSCARLHFEKRRCATRYARSSPVSTTCSAPRRAAIHKGDGASRHRETVQNLLYTKQADNAAKARIGACAGAVARKHKNLRRADLRGACCSIHELKISREDLAALGYRGREIGAVLARLLDDGRGGKTPNKARGRCKRAPMRLWHAATMRAIR